MIIIFRTIFSSYKMGANNDKIATAILPSLDELKKIINSADKTKPIYLPITFQHLGYPKRDAKVDLLYFELNEWLKKEKQWYYRLEHDPRAVLIVIYYKNGRQCNNG